MIKTLEIRNFKSIKQLKLDLRRINIFIGQPNTGKSNILETLGIFSLGCYQPYGDEKSFVRFERLSNLFYDESLEQAVEIKFDDKTLEIKFEDGRFRGKYQSEKIPIASFSGSHTNFDFWTTHAELSPFKFYRFTIRESFGEQESEFLLPPSGANLLSLLLTHKELRTLARELFSSFGFRLGLRPQESKIEVIKQYEDVIISYPYSLASETLQRLIFHLAAILSNKDSILAFEEPESHAFPYYTKYLAEVIALEENNNQYLISTHNPYFLSSILEKSPKDKVGIFVTYFKDYQTKVKLLSEKEVEEILEIDVFFNIERFIEGE